MFNQLEIPHKFFQNWIVLRMLGIRDCVLLITENGIQHSLCHTVFVLCLHSLFFMSQIRSDVWKNFVVQNQTTAKCGVPLSATK